MDKGRWTVDCGPTDNNSEEEQVDAQAQQADRQVGDLQDEGEMRLQRRGWLQGSSHSQIVDINLHVCQVLYYYRHFSLNQINDLYFSVKRTCENRKNTPVKSVMDLYNSVGN